MANVIKYKPNDIRLTVLNFTQAAVAYIFLVNDLISGKNIFLSKNYDLLAGDIFILTLEVGFSVGLFILAIYQRNYNFRLMEASLGVNRWYFTERTLNYVTVFVLITIGICLCALPYIEIRKGLATGGLFFQNHSLTDGSNLFWQMIYFHFAICAVPIVVGIWLLLFPPKKIEAKN